MSLIPKKIYQSWKSKDLPEKMAQIVQKTKEMNPEYDYELWDDKDCRQFLLDNFGQNYANAFDILIPGAFKCDFWRYAILYINGGVYMDMDMVPEVPFREMLGKDDQFVSIADLESSGFLKMIVNLPGIFQSFIACRPGHPIMKKSLELAFASIVMRRTDPATSLSITGPTIVAVAFNLENNELHTYKRIVPGNYPNGTRLLKMNKDYTYDLDGKKLFQNKYNGYPRGNNNYNYVESYYRDDPRLKYKKLLMYSFFGIVIFAVILLIFALIYMYKFRKCKQGQ
jgi:mannosyltransferase OCH1-like enzyme